MDRIALSKRLEGLSKVFASNSPMHRDLKAMSEVLNKIDDDKFKTILSTDFTPDAEEKEAIVQQSMIPTREPYQQGQGLGHRVLPGGPSKPMSNVAVAKMLSALSGRPESDFTPEDVSKVQKFVLELGQAPDFSRARNIGPMKGLQSTPPVQETAMSAEASDKNVGAFWSVEASEAILNNLVRDVVGMDKSICCDTKRHLDKDQIPDGTHNGEKAPTLKPDQTPDQSDVLKSDMYDKSKKTPLKKEAGLEDLQKQKVEKAEGDAEKAQEKAQEATKETGKALTEAEKADKKAEKAEKDEKAPTTDKKASESVYSSEGIELGEPMDEVVLDATEQEKLSKLFA